MHAATAPADPDPSTISLRQLHFLLRVAALGSVSAAAPALSRTQTAVSKAIAALERRVQARLLDRHPGGVILTPAGQILRRRAQAVVDELDIARTRLLDRAGRRATASAGGYALLLGNSRLRAFLSVFACRDPRSASSALGVSPTAIRKSLRELDARVGMPLFAPLPDGRLAPTPAAEILARHAQLAFAEIRIAVDELRALGGEARGRVVIGSVPFVRTALLPDALARFAQDHPSVRIATREAPYDELETALRSGEIDFIVGPLHRPLATEDLAAIPFVSAPVGVVVRAGHPLAAKRRLAARDVARIGWVMPPAGTPSRAAFDRLLQRRAIALPTRVIETSSYAIRRGLLLASDFAAVSPLAEFAHDLAAGTLVSLAPAFASAADQTALANDSYLVTRRRSSMSSAASALLARFIRLPAAPEGRTGAIGDPRASRSGPART